MQPQTVHLALSVPLGRNLVRRALDKGIALASLPPLYRGARDSLVEWQHPIRAPHSITYNLIRAIRARGYRVRLYRYNEHVVAAMRPGDIFIGEPVPQGGYGESRAKTDDPGSITSRTIHEFPSERNYILMPYAHDEQYIGFLRELARSNAQAGGGAIFIGGKIWERDWETRSPLADVRSLRKGYLPMAIDTSEYPTVKKRFNPTGKRKYLYIGHTAWYKNTQELERIAARMPGYEFVHIGGGEVRGWKKRSNFVALTREYLERLADEFDIFVTVSSADPQATTIMEQMCSGLAVACTPESGYEYDMLTKLSMRDTEGNVEKLRALQTTDEAELLARAKDARHIVEQNHTWAQFTDRVLGFIGI